MTIEQLEELLATQLQLDRVRRSGQNITACCPHHQETRPSWGIRIDEPHVHACFSCGYRGTLRTLLIDKGWTITAVTNLLGRYKKPSQGLTLTPESTTPVELPNEEEIWPFVLEPVAIRYMRGRGIDFNTLKTANVVYHPLDQRILFPWYLNKTFYGATGRSIDPENRVKIQAYFGLQKRSYLYSPSGAVRPGKYIPLVEGEIDALKIYQSGFHSVLALGHNHLSPSQVAHLESLPVNSHLVLMFDADEVGRKLTLDAFRTLRVRGFKNIFTVNWGSLNREGKIDPAMLDAPTLRQLITTAKRGSTWSLDSA